MSQELCPGIDDLRRLLRGELSETEAGPLETHFATCPLCGERAAALEAEEPPSPVRERDWPNGETVDRLMNRLHALLPEVPGYELLEEIARGGMGVVYKARHLALNRVVALKMILAGEHAGPQQLARFQAEAEAAARLRHPNIVPVYEVGEAGGRPFLSLEFCPGGSLADLLRQGPLPSYRAARLLEQLAEAVQSAHREQVIHRDLKPANILLTFSRDAESSERSAGASALRSEDSASRLNGVTPKITDFGLAKRLDIGDRQTHTGDLLGTPSYMAPEQAEGRVKEIGPVTDVYALGAILYEMVTGRPPHKGSSIRETLELVCQAEPVPPRTLQPSVPRDLETICLKCLRKEPGKRYASAAELAADCAAFIEGKPITARPIGNPERMLKWVKRRPAQAALGAVSVVAVVVLLTLGFWFSAEIGAARGDLKAEEARSAAHRQMAETESFFGLQRGVEKRSASQEPGWTWLNLADLKHAGQLGPAGEHLAELRSEAAAALGGLDVRLDREVVKGHYAPCVAFHPNRLLLAVGLAGASPPVSGEVRLVDLSRQDASLSLPFPTRTARNSQGNVVPDGAHGLAFSRDGRWLAAGARSGMLHLWDLKQQPPARLSWQAHSTCPENLVFSADGTVLLSASRFEREVYSWLIPTDGKQASINKPLHRYTAKGNIQSLTMHPTNGSLACAPGDNTIVFLSSQTIQPIQAPLTMPGAGPLRFTPAGELILTRGDGRLHFLNRYYQPAGATSTDAAPRESVQGLAISPEGVLLASSCWFTRQVRLWESVGGRLLAVLPLDEGARILAFSPDERWLAATAQSETRLYELARGDVQTVVAGGADPILACAVHPDGHSLATVTVPQPNLREVFVWSVVGAPTTQPDIRHTCHDWPGESNPALAFQPGSQVLAHSSAKAVVVRDSRLIKPIELAVPSWPALSFAADGRLWGAIEEDLQVWDTSTGRQAAHWRNLEAAERSGRASLYGVSAGRRWAVAGARDGEVHLFGAATGKREWGVMAFASAVRSVALRGDEAMLAAGGDTGEVAVVSVPGRAITVHKVHRDEVRALSWSGQRLLASGSRDRTVKLWQVDNGSLTELLTLRQPAGVRWLAFHPDGVRLFVLLERERAVRVWHLDRLRQRLTELGLGSGLDMIEARALPKPAPAPVAVSPVEERPYGPNALKAELFADMYFQRCAKVRYDAPIDFDWGEGSPDPLLPVDFFSIRWTGWLKAPRPGRYTLRLQADDNARLWLDGQLLIGADYQVEVELGNRPHALRVEYFEGRGLASIQLSWAQAGGFAMQTVPAFCLFHDRATAQRAGQLLAASDAVEQGIRLWEKGHSSAAMLWLARALELAPSATDQGKELQQSIRLSLAWCHGRYDAPKAQMKHLAGVQSVSWSPDSRLVVTASSDKSARIWEAATGKPVGKPLVHPDMVCCAVFSPNGKTIATGCLDHVVRLWDAATQRLLGQVREENQISSLAFLPRQDVILVVGSCRDIRFWDVRKCQPITGPRPCNGFVDALAVSPDGLTVLTGAREKRAYLWSTKSYLWVKRIDHKYDVQAVAFCPEGDRFVTGALDGQVQFWDGNSCSPIGPTIRHKSPVTALAMSPDGKTLATGSNDHSARLWNAGDRKLLAPPLLHQGYVNGVAFSPDGKKLATASTDKTVRIWEVPPPLTGDVKRLVCWLQVETGMELTKDGQLRKLDNKTLLERRRMLQSLGGPPKAGGLAMQPVPAAVLFHDRATAQPARPQVAPPLKAELVRTLNVPGATTRTALLLANGKQLVTGGHDSIVRCLDLDTGRQTASLRIGKSEQVQLLTPAPNGNQVLVTCGKVTMLWDPATGKEVRQFHGDGHGLWVNVIALQPGGKLLASATWTPGPEPMAIRVWDTCTGKTVWLHSQRETTEGLVWTADGKRLVAVQKTGQIEVWDPVANKRVWEQRLPKLPPITRLASAPGASGHWVAVPRHNPGRLDLYALQEGRLTPRWSASCGQAVWHPRFSADGRLVAVMEPESGIVFFHDLQTGLEVGRIECPGTRLHEFTLSPDGAFAVVVTKNPEKQVLIWKLTKSRQGVR